MDKRKHRRLELADALACRVFQEGRLLELSIGGAFVLTDRPLAKGSTVTFEVALPGDRTVRARTLVTRVGDYYEGAGSQPAMGMGLSFVEISPEDRIAITRFLKSVYTEVEHSARVHASLRARVRDGDDWIDAVVREIEERSLVLRMPAGGAVGAEIHFLVKLPNARVPVEGRGVVQERIDGDEPGVRIEFSELDPRARALLDSFLRDARAERAPGLES